MFPSLVTQIEVQNEDDVDDNFSITEYDITAVPNDFNVKTIYDFILSGTVIVPDFQRNFVWDIKRASKLIESLLIGLPIPQIFLYEEDRNRYLVIDGQQRLMSIYYFMKKRFPRDDKRVEIRKIFEERKSIPDSILSDDSYFINFNLKLPSSLPGTGNKFNGLNYDTLDSARVQLDMRTVRNVIIRQVGPSDDDSAMYEIFNRLNSGGVNLTPQEIRYSLYHSNFYSMVGRLNMLPDWRRFIGSPNPDIHAKDIEIIVRCFAMLCFRDQYKPSMTRFLNASSKKFKHISDDEVSYFEDLFISFLKACSSLPNNVFNSSKGNRFNISIFESVFVAVCDSYYKAREAVTGSIDAQKMDNLKSDDNFSNATLYSTATSANLKTRMNVAFSNL